MRAEMTPLRISAWVGVMTMERSSGRDSTNSVNAQAVSIISGPIVELHISNIHRREAHYHHSYVSKVATAVIAGLGPRGYPVAVRAVLDLQAAASKVS